MKDQRVYLRDVIERIDRILEFTRDGRDKFIDSLLVQDAVLRNFQVIGEAVKHMDDHFRDEHTTVNWRQLTGFRDVLVHEYDRLILSQVWNAIDGLSPIREQIATILQELEREAEDNDAQK